MECLFWLISGFLNPYLFRACKKAPKIQKANRRTLLKIVSAGWLSTNKTLIF